jgi:TonB family protein
MRRILVLALMAAAAAACAKPVPKLVTPKAIENPLPQPEEVAATKAAQAGKSGAVRVSYCVDVEGKAQRVTVKQTVDPEYDRIAVETVQRWTFEPATRDGAPYEHCSEVSIDFQPSTN